MPLTFNGQLALGLALALAAAVLVSITALVTAALSKRAAERTAGAAVVMADAATTTGDARVQAALNQGFGMLMAGWVQANAESLKMVADLKTQLADMRTEQLATHDLVDGKTEQLMEAVRQIAHAAGYKAGAEDARTKTAS